MKPVVSLVRRPLRTQNVILGVVDSSNVGHGAMIKKQNAIVSCLLLSLLLSSLHLPLAAGTGVAGLHLPRYKHRGRVDVRPEAIESNVRCLHPVMVEVIAHSIDEHYRGTPTTRPRSLLFHL